MDNQNNIEVFDMPEQNNGNQQGTIKPQVMGANVPLDKKSIKRSAKASQVVRSSQNKSRLVIILVVLLAVGFFLYKSLPGLNLKLPGSSKEPGSENFKIDTGYDWADIYANYIHTYYDEFELKAMDITFIDFNEDGKPEMAVKHPDKQGNYLVRVYQINNKEVTETKSFYNSQFKLIYSSISGNINWYIYIGTTGKYGSYTLMSKILKGDAKDSDIKATNETELTSFNKNYLASSYKPNYYEVKRSKFADDYKTIAERYKGYNDDAKLAKNKLEADTANWLQEQQTGNVKTSITVNGFVLRFGEYKAKVNITELGVVKEIEKTIILKDGYLVVNGSEVKYTAYPSFITVADGTAFRVLDNNQFTYGNDGGKYKLQE